MHSGERRLQSIGIQTQSEGEEGEKEIQTELKERESWGGGGREMK